MQTPQGGKTLLHMISPRRLSVHAFVSLSQRSGEKDTDITVQGESKQNLWCNEEGQDSVEYSTEDTEATFQGTVWRSNG